jgi:type IV pilus assembly protein PilE
MPVQRGFTLIELMIVLVILAVLVAIAYPSYTRHVMKSRRADGIAALQRAALVMESCRSDTASYAGCAFPASSADNFYTITAASTITATAYSFIATPRGAQANDTRCATLTLDSRGNRGHTGSAATSETCWGQ